MSARKNYKKPVIISQNSFETSALSCAKTMPNESGHLGSGTTYITGSGTMGEGTFHISPGFTSTSVPCEAVLFVS